MDLPPLHRQFLDDVLPRIQREAGVIGVAASGSLASGNPDTYSDIDLVIVIDETSFEPVMTRRLELIGSWTDLVAGFTGEHVGEPRLIITLVGPPLLHVDFKFVRLTDFAERSEDPHILWERDEELSRALAQQPAKASRLDLQWIEDRFWTWVHYGATKLGRGELLEVAGFLAYLREAVLGPLAAVRAGAPPRGVRRLESVAPDEARALRATLSGENQIEAGWALLACVDLYGRWRDESGMLVERRRNAEQHAVRYLRDVLAATGRPARDGRRGPIDAVS
ncbi:nucleotidyltransferase domain-containing protein [Streptomyces sp. 6N106]|uniref:nucleotidyltransferase domain-containing protein n=1 Tax=Streptomyces sp. 6N106 TaxID=3457418 RepID=UPI003FD2F381